MSYGRRRCPLARDLLTTLGQRAIHTRRDTQLPDSFGIRDAPRNRAAIAVAAQRANVEGTNYRCEPPESPVPSDRVPVAKYVAIRAGRDADNNRHNVVAEGSMRTPASIARHPIHPMLVPLPIGLWVFSFACDLIFTFGPHTAVWKTVALYTMVGGLIGALLAALPGLIDLLSLPAGPRTTAIIHMSVNLTVVALFAINIWLRVSAGDMGASSTGTVWLSVIAIGLLLVSGWLGGKLVYEGGVAVDTESLK
jgi:uncharacterized membrane protein